MSTTSNRPPQESAAEKLSLSRVEKSALDADSDVGRLPPDPDADPAVALENLVEMLSQLEAENESLRQIVDADLPLREATARLRERDRQLEGLTARINGLLDEKGQAIMAARRWKRKYDALQSEIARRG